MAQTTGDVIVEQLLEWGVDTVFGLPGDGINGIFEALRKNREKIRFIQCRHEEAAAFAACGYAKFTGRLGVCIATSGPGAIHLLNGLYDAKIDHAPVLAITGQTYHDLMGTFFQQEIDILTLFNDVASYNHMILGANHAPRAGRPRVPVGLVDSERRAPHLSRRLSGPDDLRRAGVAANGFGAYVRGWRPPIVVPQRRDAGSGRGTAERGKKSVILAGQGALGAGTSSSGSPTRWPRRSSRRCWARRSSPTTPRTRPAASACWARSPPRRRWRSATPSCLVGTSFPYLQWYPKPDQAKAVQIDRDPTRIGLRYPVDIGLVGDARRPCRPSCRCSSPRRIARSSRRPRKA